MKEDGADDADDADADVSSSIFFCFCFFCFVVVLFFVLWGEARGKKLGRSTDGTSFVGCVVYVICIHRTCCLSSTREGIKSKSKARHHYDHHQASCRREGSVIFDHVIIRTSSKNETN